MKNVKRFKRLISFMVSALMIFNIAAVSLASAKVVDAKMYWSDDFENGAWADIEGETAEAVFGISDFEPGSTALKYLKIENAGTLAFSYALNFVSASEVGTLADVIDVYFLDDVTGNVSISDMTSIGTLSDVINGNAISQGKILPEDLTGDGFYTGARYAAVALKMKDNAGSEYMNQSIGDGFTIQLSVNECDYDGYPPVDKFELAFPNTDDYIYRVGNMNEVKLGSLFKALDGAEIGNVTVKIEPIDNTTDVSGAFTPNSTWTASTIKFSGTGSVKVTIDDDDNANELSLNLEVINAKNLTSAASVTSADAVLLNDVTFSTIEVSNGYTLYGNGFKLHAPNDVTYSDWSYSFVNLENGTLDNVKVICPNYSHQVLYQYNMKEEENQHDGDFYYNTRAAVKMSGNCHVVNSYVSGGRVAIFASSGYPVIENSMIYGGAAANIQVLTVHNLTLKDTTLIQEPIQANVNDTSKTIMGLSVVTMCDADGNSSPITIEGDFVQYAWANKDYAQYVPSAAEQFIDMVFTQEKFIHSVTYKDGVTRESVNLGFLYMPDSVTSSVGTPSITDNRSKKTDVPYSIASITRAYVYSYDNTNGLDSSFTAIPEYISEKSGNIPAEIKYNSAESYVTTSKAYDENNGWMSTVTVNLDSAADGSYSFDFDNLIAEKYDRNLSYTVKDSSGNAVDKNAAIVLNDSGVYDYVLEITDDVFYGADGQVIDGISETYTYNVKLIATKTSIAPPENLTESWENPLLVVKSKDGDWSAAIPASLSTIKIKFYSAKEKTYKEAFLGDLITLSSTGKQNETNNYWEYKDANGDFTFKATCGVIHEGKDVYGMPVVVPYNGVNTMYFVITSTNGYVSTGTTARTVTVDYEFTDSNGSTIKFSNTWNAVRQDMLDGKTSDGIQYKYSDFVNGTLTDTSASSGDSGCLTEGTLITLADGSRKAVEELTFDDEVLTWSFFNGEYEAVPATLLINDGKKEYTVISLNFDDGTALKIIDVHGLYDADLNEYVYITHENAENYVGHSFMKTDMNENGEISTNSVKLVGYDVSTEYIGCYTLLTAVNNNCIADGILTVTPPPVDGWYDYFEIGDDMKYVNMEEDIERYGLYTYDDFSEYISYEEFIAFNGPYLKILVEKEYFTFEDILGQIEAFGVGSDVPVALEIDETADDTVISAVNTIATAGYSITVTGEAAATDEANVFMCNSKNNSFTLTAEGTASTGYAKIVVDGDEYYTVQIPQGESVVINVKNAKDKTVEITSSWGLSANYGVSQDGLYAGNSTIDLGELTIKAVEKTSTGVSATLSNTTKYDVTGDVYVAVYSSDNRLISARFENITIAAKDEYTYSPVVDLPENCTVKAFVWETAGMKPIVD